MQSTVKTGCQRATVRFVAMGAMTLGIGLAFFVSSAAQAQDNCKGEGRLNHICGLNNPEDILLIEGSPWVLVSNLGDRTWANGGFYAVDTRNKSVRTLVPDYSRPMDPLYKTCPGAPDAQKLSSHGLSVRADGGGKSTVYAVNHGGRKSIEVFDLDVSAGEPRMTWKGCAVMPTAVRANSVAHLPDNGFVVTAFSNPADKQSMAKAYEGQPSGFAFEWSPATGEWSQVPGSELSGNNGILASKDGQWLYIAGYANRTVNKISRGRVPVLRESVSVSFLVDNLRFAPDGSVLAAGHLAPLKTIIEGCNGTAVVTCPVPTGVARIDPEKMTAESLLVEPNTANFGGGTSAIVVGDELWIASFRAQRLATIPLQALQP